MDEYRDFAADYHWLFPDRVLSGEDFVVAHDELLGTLAPGARVLDCACGIGADAIGLARRGYRVTGTDASAAMVAEAKERARAAGVDVAFSVCPWDDLPGRFGAEPFDLVVCRGNSFAHAPSQEALVGSLRAIRAVVAPGGRLVVGSRTWEKLAAERRRVTLVDEAPVRGGRRATTLYVWTLAEGWGGAHTAEIVMVFDDDGALSHRRYPVRMRPFPLDELLGALSAAGFGSLEHDWSMDADFYEVVATAA